MNPEDITAYALGEMNKAQINEFEKAITPEVQEQIDEIREFSLLLEDGFQNEEELQLEDSHREEILAENSQPKKPANIWRFWPVFAAAAGCATFVLAMNQITPSNEYETSHMTQEEEIQTVQEHLSDELEPKIDGTISADAPVVEESILRKEKSIKESKDVLRFNSVPSSSRADSLMKNEARKKVEVQRQVMEQKKSLSLKRQKSKLARAVSIADSEELGFSDTDDFSGGLGAPQKCRIMPQEPPLPPQDTNKYGQYEESHFKSVLSAPLSTFSIDVDTASYTQIRSQLMRNVLPNPDAVRIEEMINYFDYSYVKPQGDKPFSLKTELGDSLWSENKILRVSIDSRQVDLTERPNSNLVFLVDVSGSMSNANKLPLLKQGLQRMVDRLTEKDSVSIVVYAGRVGTVLQPTACSEQGKNKIISSLQQLHSGGSTNGAGGIEQAYKLAQENFISDGVNRVLLCTDGDFNVGLRSTQSLVDLVVEKAKSNIFLTVLGFGHGNLNDYMLEEISNKGNGTYFFIDSIEESYRVLCEKLYSTLNVLAKDVKIQVEFNPAQVKEYRLIGYDNRRLKDRDFNDDTKDAGEVGMGHNVTVLYELVMSGIDIPLKYQENQKQADLSEELMTLKLRYKEPKESVSKLLEWPVIAKTAKLSSDFYLARSVAGFGLLLKNSKYKGELKLNNLLNQVNDLEHSSQVKDLKQVIEKYQYLAK